MPYSKDRTNYTIASSPYNEDQIHSIEPNLSDTEGDYRGRYRSRNQLKFSTSRPAVLSKKGTLAVTEATAEGWKARSGSSGSAFVPKTPPPTISSCEMNAVNDVQYSPPQAGASSGIPRPETPRPSPSSSGTSSGSELSKRSPLQELSTVCSLFFLTALNAISRSASRTRTIRLHRTISHAGLTDIENISGTMMRTCILPE